MKGIKAIKQAGVYNFLGKQKMITVPIKWKSGKDHPDTELAYITKPEKELLIKLDLHGSMKDGKPNKGPGGIISLNSGGSGDVGPDSAGSSGSSDSGGSFDGTESLNNEGFGSHQGEFSTGSGYDYEGKAYGTPDTITSFGNNYAANMASYGPLGYAVPGLGLLTGIQTAIQTDQANRMMGLSVPYSEPPTIIGGSDGDSRATPYIPTAPKVSDEVQPKQNFFNLGIVPLLLGK